MAKNEKIWQRIWMFHSNTQMAKHEESSSSEYLEVATAVMASGEIVREAPVHGE